VLCIAVQATLGGTDAVEDARKSELFPDIPLERCAAIPKFWAPRQDFFQMARTDPAWPAFQDEVDDVQELCDIPGTEEEAEMRFRVRLPPPFSPDPY